MYVHVNDSLYVQTQVVALSKLSTDAVTRILERAAESNGCVLAPDDGIYYRPDGDFQEVMRGALEYLANMSDGDAR